MNNTDKTKEELLKDLRDMQCRVETLQKKIELLETNTHIKKRSPRKKLQSDIEFIGDFDIVQAEGVNLSNDGICLKMKNALPIEMQFTLNGEQCRRRAQLVWVKQLSNEGYCFGLKFVDSESEPIF